MFSEAIFEGSVNCFKDIIKDLIAWYQNNKNKSETLLIVNCIASFDSTHIQWSI